MESLSVAVAVAAYNRADLLPEMLDGLAAQTLKRFTVHVCYDGSTDETPMVLQRYADRLRIVCAPYRDERCVGTAKRRAVTSALAYGAQFVQMVDSDDVPLPRLLEANRDQMLRDHVDWVLCWGRTFGDNDGYVHAEIPTLIEQIELNTLQSWAMWSAALLRGESYRPGLRFFDDWDLWLRVRRAGFRGAINAQELYRHRIHPARLTTTEEPALGLSWAERRRHVLELNGLYFDRSHAELYGTSRM